MLLMHLSRVWSPFFTTVIIVKKGDLFLELLFPVMLTWSMLYAPDFNEYSADYALNSGNRVMLYQ